jgi:hypothetical protein
LNPQYITKNFLSNHISGFTDNKGDKTPSLVLEYVNNIDFRNLYRNILAIYVPSFMTMMLATRSTSFLKALD